MVVVRGIKICSCPLMQLSINAVEEKKNVVQMLTDSLDPRINNTYIAKTILQSIIRRTKEATCILCAGRDFTGAFFETAK